MISINIVLMEDKRAPYFSSELREKFPKSCTIRLTFKSDKSVLKLLEHPPTLRSQWLVIVERGCPDNLISLVAKCKNSINLVMSDQLSSKRHFSLLRGLGETRLVDMITADEQTCVDMVKKRLDISDNVAKELVKLCSCYLPHLEENIVTLECLGGPITKTDLTNYIQRKNNLTVYSLFYHLVGVKAAPEKQLVNYLHDYRHAVSYIRKKLLGLFDIAVLAYSFIESGELGVDNVDEFIKNNKLKVSAYFVKKIVDELHKCVDYSSLLLLRYKVDKTNNMVTLLSFI